MTDTRPGPAQGTPATPPAATSRAGRDLPAAVAVGALLGGMVIAICVFAPRWWVAVVAVAMAVATWEVVRRLREAGHVVPLMPLLVGGQAMIWLTWPFGATGALGAFGGTVVVLLVSRLLAGGLGAAPTNYLRDVAVSVLVLAWVPLCGAFGALLADADDGRRVLVFMLGVTFSDMGGYAAGVLFGRHPMVPAISPRKSWEGLVGSLVFGTAAAVAGVTLLLDAPAWVGLPLGVMLVLTATLGDLVESQVKRDLGIKDMGTLLPGHGGLMDRLDSVLPSAVATWIVLALLG